MTDGKARTLAYVRAAIASVPTELARALEVPLPHLSHAPGSVVTTGVGASEGPARMLAALLAEAGLRARFCPVSRFVARAQPRASTAELLIVFSQGLSPNARLALNAAQDFAACWLVTSLCESNAPERKRALLARLVARGVTPIVVPPAHEPEALARFCGPTVAALTALRLGALLLADRTLAQRLLEAPNAYVARGPHVGRLEAPLALIDAGAPAESSYAHRWRLLETLLLEDPPVWDVLQFAHGPLQAFHDKPLTLLLLEDASSQDQVARLERTLDPARHRLVRLSASAPAPLSFFQHTAELDALLLAELELSPRDLFDWPGRHGDAPLYGLGEDEG